MGKTLGILLIMTACGLFAYAKVQDLKRRLSNLAEMERALFLMRHEISFSARELWEACDGLAASLNGQVGELFYHIGEALKADETLRFQEAWEQYAEDLFSPQVQKTANSFAATFGTLSREVEENSIDRCIEALGRLRGEETEAYKKNRKLIYTLCLGGGLAVLILLI